MLPYLPSPSLPGSASTVPTATLAAPAGATAPSTPTLVGLPTTSRQSPPPPTEPTAQQGDDVPAAPPTAASAAGPLVHARSVSRPSTPVLSQLLTASAASPVPDKDFLCPICHEVIKEAFITRCGHSYCYLCIVQQLEFKKDCPTCKAPVTRDGIFPNFLLNRLLTKQTRSTQATASPVQYVQESLSKDVDQLNMRDINSLLHTLIGAKKRLEAEQRETDLELLHDFLARTKQQKSDLIAQLNEEIQFLGEDLEKVEARRSLFLPKASLAITSAAAGDPANQSSAEVPILEEDNGDVRTIKRQRLSDSPDAGNGASNAGDVAAGGGDAAAAGAGSTVDAKERDLLVAKKRRIQGHFEDLQSCYFNCRRTGNSDDSLDQFSDNLSNFTRYSRYNVLATLKYGDMFNASSIVSSIEFDRDDEYFATAGVTKKIKIFEYANILNEVADVHFPIREMSCRSKISCLSWNSYVKSQIASSDYEGIISLWDANVGQTVIQFEEHEKRAWSVDFSRTDPRLLVSASDDTTAKLWSSNQEHSTMTIRSKANICCAKFNPESAHHIAFGSADHHIHYYDLRRPREPLFVLKGHRKAVSYVKFLNREEVVSASTDSTLKLWSVETGECKRSFTGHTNEKNFVGLTANGDYISCGSEKNALYTYYKAVSKPVVHFKFGSSNPLTGEESDEDEGQFVSSVCWKKNSNVLLAANSQGTIKIMELV